MLKSNVWLKACLLVCLCALCCLSVRAQSSDDVVATGHVAPGDAATGDASEAAKQLSDRDPLVRQRGAEVLARLAASEWRHLVEGYRLQEKNARVKIALDWALYRMGKPEALYEVVRALDSPRAEQAAGYLAQLETPEPLYPVLPRVNGNTQIKLLEVLGRSGNEATLEQIKPYEDSIDPKIADAARHAEEEIARRSNEPPADANTRPRKVTHGKPPTP
jgi:hypothetical protein